jgi:hypothetical protein
VRYTFKGDTVTVYHSKGPNYGVAKVYIDGVEKATIDMYHGSYIRSQQTLPINTEDTSKHWVSQPIPVFYSSGGQRRDTHVIEIVVSGSKNGSSSDYYVDVDRIFVSEDRLDVRRDVNQHASNWCWISVAQISGEYATNAVAGPGTNNYTRQCELIKAYKGTSTCANVAGYPWEVATILYQYYGTSSNYNVAGAMDEINLLSQLFSGKPVISTWSWNFPLPGGHMIIIRGYSSVTNTYQVVIPDPTSGSPILTNRSYSSLVNGTQFGASYSWQGSIFDITRN